MRRRHWISLVLFLALGLLGTACIQLDFFMFNGTPASLEDYDFTLPELDGTPPERITSTLIPSAEPGVDIHIIYIERDVKKLDPRLSADAPITVIFSHGQSGNMLNYFYRMGYYEDMGFNVLMYDYRGYGASGGEASEPHLAQDVTTVYDWLKEREDSGTIFSAGYSMGGFPASWLCSPRSERAVAGCFTESAFASTDQIIDEGAGYDFEGSWFVEGEMDNEALFAEITIPVLMMHGTADPKVSFENGEILWRAVQDNHPQNTFYAIKGATHSNVPVPSHNGDEEPEAYSHPDEFPDVLAEEFTLYKARIVDFVVDAMTRNSL